MVGFMRLLFCECVFINYMFKFIVILDVGFFKQMLYEVGRENFFKNIYDCVIELLDVVNGEIEGLI